MYFLKKQNILLFVLAALLIGAANSFANAEVRSLILQTGTATLDGEAVPEYDYAWHADPTVVHDEVKNAPAEYYTGTKPSGEDAVYIAHDLFYYPEVNTDGYKTVFYDDEWEWVYYYPVEEYSEYIWANLPIQGNEVPERMMHSEEEAWNNPVLHITNPGTYELSGIWHGQIWIDLGDQDDTFTDETAKVTLILNGVDVTCDAAPALVFYSVYEADNGWEDRDNYGPEVDISDAGAKVILADDSVNNFTGTNVYRMLKAKYKDDNSTDEVKVQKKQRKIDGAFYSFRSMLIDGQEKGNGILNVTAGFEGMDSELHLTINGGKVNIQSQDDGMNVNEDGVSVLTVNGGELHIVAGLGAEGDGVDSNGYLVVNGGMVISAAKPMSDSGLDSDRGSYVNGGYVVATGSTMDWAETQSRQVTMNLQFSADQASDEAIIITDLDGKVIFAYDPDKDETTGSNNRGYRGAVISSPEFRVGETYHVYVGGNVEGNETDGLYDVTTVTGFSGAKRQMYTGTDVRGFGPGRPGGFPGGPETEFADIEGFTMNDDRTVSITLEAAEKVLAIIKERNPESEATVEQIAAITDMRELFDLMGHGRLGPDGRGGFPGGPEGMPPMPPDGRGGFPGGPEGMPPMPPDGQGGFPGGPGGMPPMPPDRQGGFPGNFEGQNAGEPSADFFMNDTVNAFSGVTDEE